MAQNERKGEGTKKEELSLPAFFSFFFFLKRLGRFASARLEGAKKTGLQKNPSFFVLDFQTRLKQLNWNRYCGIPWQAYLRTLLCLEPPINKGC